MRADLRDPVCDLRRHEAAQRFGDVGAASGRRGNCGRSSGDGVRRGGDDPRAAALTTEAHLRRILRTAAGTGPGFAAWVAAMTAEAHHLGVLAAAGADPRAHVSSVSRKTARYSRTAAGVS